MPLLYTWYIPDILVHPVYTRLTVPSALTLDVYNYYSRMPRVLPVASTPGLLRDVLHIGMSRTRGGCSIVDPLQPTRAFGMNVAPN